jgi:hypothetical protein
MAISPEGTGRVFYVLRIVAMTDKTTKVLLALIALGLWANVMKPLFRPVLVTAQDSTSSVLSSINSHLSTIEHDVHSLADIEDGTCRNSKICR